MKIYTTSMIWFFLFVLTVGLPLNVGAMTGTPAAAPGQPAEGEDTERLYSGLITFAATPVGDVNRVQWSISNDPEIATVTVERVARGTTEWVALAAYRAEGSSKVLSEFEYIDAMPLAEAGYRLRITLSDGSSAVSEEIVVVRASDLFSARQPARYAVGTGGAQ